MDESNLKGMVRIAPDRELVRKARLLMDFAPDRPHEVPDPYYGGAEGFEEVYRMLTEACENLLNGLRYG